MSARSFSFGAGPDKRTVKSSWSRSKVVNLKSERLCNTNKHPMGRKQVLVLVGSVAGNNAMHVTHQMTITLIVIK